MTSWGPEVNFYISFILYAISGRMAEADSIMRKYSSEIKTVAAKMHNLMPRKINEIYRGLLIEPENLGPGNTISKDPNNTFASFSEDKQVACWFADPSSAMSQLVRMTRPRVRGWVVSTTPKREDILFHWAWGLGFPLGGRKVGFDVLMRSHPEFVTFSSLERSIRSQKEVILLPTEEIFTAVPVEKASCLSTSELDTRFGSHDPRSF